MLSQLNLKKSATVIGVIDHSPAFLQYIEKLGIKIGNTIKMKEIIDYDKSLSISINNKFNVYVSHDVAKNILISIWNAHDCKPQTINECNTGIPYDH